MVASEGESPEPRTQETAIREAAAKTLRALGFEETQANIGVLEHEFSLPPMGTKLRAFVHEAIGRYLADLAAHPGWQPDIWRFRNRIAWTRTDMEQALCEKQARRAPVARPVHVSARAALEAECQALLVVFRDKTRPEDERNLARSRWKQLMHRLSADR